MNAPESPPPPPPVAGEIEEIRERHEIENAPGSAIWSNWHECNRQRATLLATVTRLSEEYEEYRRDCVAKWTEIVERMATEHAKQLSSLQQTVAAEREGERIRIAKHLRTVGNDLLRDKESDAVDGYVSAVLIDLAGVIENNGSVDRAAIRSRSDGRG